MSNRALYSTLNGGCQVAIRPKSGLRPLTVNTLLHCSLTGLQRPCRGLYIRATVGSEEGPLLHYIELDRLLLYYTLSTNLLKSIEKFPL